MKDTTRAAHDNILGSGIRNRDRLAAEALASGRTMDDTLDERSYSTTNLLYECRCMVTGASDALLRTTGSTGAVVSRTSNTCRPLSPSARRLSFD